MEPAARVLGEAIKPLSLGEPEFPVWSNVSASPHIHAEIPHALVDQVTSTVRFSDILLDMHTHGISTFVHVGPGDVTAGLARRTLTESRVLTVSGLADIPPVLDALGTM
jgi:[acyl-carrier-protein] S-malonyltransferase